jgi:hypothetical protein
VRLFVFLHVTTMFLAVASSGGAEILVHRVAGTRDLPGIRTVLATYGVIARFIPILFLIGFAFGLTAVFVEGFNPFQGWLILAYVLFASGVAVGAIVNGGWANRLASASAQATDANDPAFVAALDDRSGIIGLWVFWLITVALVFVMIVKPLS